MARSDLKMLNYLHKSIQQFPILIVVGMLIWLLLLIAAPLGIVYDLQRRRFLKKLDAGKLDDTLQDDEDAREKIEKLRQTRLMLYLPAILVGFVAITFAYVILTF